MTPSAHANEPKFAQVHTGDVALSLVKAELSRPTRSACCCAALTWRVGYVGAQYAGVRVKITQDVVDRPGLASTQVIKVVATEDDPLLSFFIDAFNRRASCDCTEPPAGMPCGCGRCLTR
jgi:hypothetical protein